MITLGQIGVGEWGRNLLRAFLSISTCHVKKFYDQNPRLCENISTQYNRRVELAQSSQEICEDSDIDAVIIATPPVTHAELAIQALSLNKHVFVEKPLALNLNDALKMIELAKSKERILMVGHLMLYHPAVRKLKSYIDEGRLGDIHYLYSTRVNLGRIREMENALWSLTAHDISVAMYLLNKIPIEVSAVGKSYLQEHIQDVVFVTLNFDNNVMSHTHASWLDPHKIRQFTVVGSKMMAVFNDMESTEKIRLYDKGVNRKKEGDESSLFSIRDGDIYIPKTDMTPPLMLECHHFLNCISQKRSALSDEENGLSVLKVLDAAHKSLQLNGKSIKI